MKRTGKKLHNCYSPVSRVCVLFLYLSFYLFGCLSLSLFFYSFSFSVPLSLPLSMPLSLPPPSSLSLSFALSLSVSFSLSLSLSVCLALSLSLARSLSVCLSLSTQIELYSSLSPSLAVSFSLSLSISLTPNPTSVLDSLFPSFAHFLCLFASSSLPAPLFPPRTHTHIPTQLFIVIFFPQPLSKTLYFFPSLSSCLCLPFRLLLLHLLSLSHPLSTILSLSLLSLHPTIFSPLSLSLSLAFSLSFLSLPHSASSHAL